MASELKTYGDLKKLIGYVQKKQKNGKLISKGKSIAIDTVMGLIGAGAAKSAFDFFKTAYDTPDTVKTDTWLDKLDVNDDYSDIVDDSVENGFLKDLVDVFNKIPNEKPLNQDFSMDIELEEYLSRRFNKKTVTGENINKKSNIVNERKVPNIYNKNKQTMSKKIENIIKKNLNSLYEEHGFEDMEVAFGVQHKHDNLSDEEKNQFGDMEELKFDVEKKGTSLGKASVEPKLQSIRKGVGKDAKDYYKEVSSKMKKFQSTEGSKESQIGEDFVPPKRNVEDGDEEDFMYNGHMGTGMTGLRYDDEGSENHKKFEERIGELNDDDETYEKLDKYGKKYKEYKYGDKFKKVEDDYHDTPKVRATQKENVMKYSDVIKENIFRTKGEIKSKEQVIKVINKIPSRVKVDETVFAITDGDNFYRLMWEGSEDGDAVITHNKNNDVMSEGLSKMKAMWEFDSKDSISTKKTITESGDDAFRRMYNRLKNSEGLTKR